MTENQSISEKERMDYQSGRDMLSDLPLSIMHMILALVPIRDAIRTSIMSRQWRYTWASLPQLVFDDESICYSMEMPRQFETRMINFITQTLFHHKGPIHQFKMSIVFQSRCPDIEEWIRCLSRNNIKEVILDMGEPEYYMPLEVHSSIYSCEKLTNLELNNCRLDPPPLTFKGFLFLWCLCLRDICMSCDEIECLVANCPLLESFVLWAESERSKLRIISPNLKYLNIWGDYSELCMSAPLLAELSISLGYDNFIAKLQPQKSSVCNYTSFMGGFTKLEKLSGDDNFIKYLGIVIESCHHTLVFHHLKDIELYKVNFEDIKDISVVARLVIGSPNLQKLKISTDFLNIGGSEPQAPHLSFRDFGCGPNFIFAKLRVVKAFNVSGLPLEIEFLKLLLESSPMLETMNFVYLGTNERKFADQLLGFSQASPNAKLSFV